MKEIKKHKLDNKKQLNEETNIVYNKICYKGTTTDKQNLWSGYLNDLQSTCQNVELFQFKSKNNWELVVDLPESRLSRSFKTGWNPNG